MAHFNTNIFGYNKEEVEKYFFRLESQHISILSQKKLELNLVRNKINQLHEENNKISYAIEQENRKKADYLNYMNQELSAIDSSLKKKQEEANEEKLAALEELKRKKTGLQKEQQYIKQMKKELNTINNKKRLLDQLYDQS